MKIQNISVRLFNFFTVLSLFFAVNIFSGEKLNLTFQIDYEKYLTGIAKKHDTILSDALKECSKSSNGENFEYFEELANKLQAKSVSLNRYFGAGDNSNEMIIKIVNEEVRVLLNKAIKNLKKRLDAYNIKSYVIKQFGRNCIKAEFDSDKNINELSRLLLSEGKLEFKLVLKPDSVFSLINSIDSVYAGRDYQQINDKINLKTGNDTADFKKAHPLLGLFNPLIMSNKETYWYIEQSNMNEFIRIVNTERIKNFIPDTVEFLFSKTGYGTIDQKIYELFAVKKVPELTGEVITKASAEIDPQNSVSLVNFKMNSGGAKKFAEITENNIKRRLAIVIDNIIYSAPVIMSKITGGKCQLSGLASVKEAQLYAAIFSSGILPIPLKNVYDKK